MKSALRVLLLASLVAIPGMGVLPATAQTTPSAPAAAEAQAPQPLSDDELEILVARIALYPDELVALISAASLYPLQVIEGDRFLADLKTNKALKPKADWDGSIISLLNYPEIVHMMSEDLDWTKMMGEAIVNQQDDVLAAIQQLREKAVAEGVIKSDDKVKVVEQNDNIVIQPASKEVIYVPQYPPEMLYEEDYVYQPVSYYPDPYPYYYNPGAAFFAGAITGAFWGAIIDWDDGFWGGNWGGNWGGDIDIDIDCDRCIIGNDFNGKLNIRDADWKNIDRSKINFDRAQLNKLDRTKINDGLKRNDGNRLKNKAADAGLGNRASTLPSRGGKPVKDVRASTLEGLKKQPGAKPGGKGDKMGKPGQGKVGDRPAQGNKVGQAGNKKAAGKVDRPVGKKKAGTKVDKRPKNPSPMGDVKRGTQAKKQSNRGAQSMGGGGYNRPSYGGGGGQSVKRRPVSRGSGGRGGGGGGRGRR